MPSVFDFSFNCKLAMSRWLAGSIISTHLIIILSISLDASNENDVAAYPGQCGLIVFPSIFIGVLSGNKPSVNNLKNMSYTYSAIC